MKPMVVGFAGRRGSGKSTIGETVATRLTWPFASFGAWIRKIARSRGLPEADVSVLQDLGASLVATDLRGLCLGCLGDGGWRSGMPAIVEGVRHAAAIPVLTDLASPLPFVLIYVDLNEAIREERLAARDGVAADKIVLYDTHSTEVDSKSRLRAMANLVVEGDSDPGRLADEVVAWCKAHGV